MEHQYPALQRQGQREGAQIHAWRRDGPALGPSDRHLLGAQGPDSGREDHRQRFGCNLISTLTNYGTLRFQVFEGSFTTEVFLDFLRRLVRSVPRKVFLIVDRHPVHRAHRVQQWVAQHSDQIELFYLPPYVPSTTQRSTSTRRSWPMLGARGGFTMQPD